MKNENLKLDNLSSVEWEVYHLLKARSKRGLWTSQKTIQHFLECLGVKEDLRRTRQHVYNIRHCSRIQKVILSSNDGYKIMTSIKEESEYLEQIKIGALKKLKQYYKEVERLKRDGQMRITFDTEERDHIEALLKGVK